MSEFTEADFTPCVKCLYPLVRVDAASCIDGHCADEAECHRRIITTLITEKQKEIFAEIPKRLNINAIVLDARDRMFAAVKTPDEVALSFIRDALTEVIREIATYAVAQFEGRTGQKFFWSDDPEPEPEATLMHFSVDVKGNVVF